MHQWVAGFQDIKEDDRSISGKATKTLVSGYILNYFLKYSDPNSYVNTRN